MASESTSGLMVHLLGYLTISAALAEWGGVILAWVGVFALALAALVVGGLGLLRLGRGLGSSESLSAFMEEDRAQTDAEKTLKAGAAISSTGGLVVLIRDYLIGGPIYAAAIEIVEAIDNFGSDFANVFSTWFRGLADVIGSVFTGEIIDAGARISIQNLPQFGILAFLVAIVITFGGLVFMLRILRRYDWNPVGSIYQRIRQ